MLRKRLSTLLAFGVLGLALVGLGAYLIQHSQFNLDPSNPNGLSVSSSFPQANCTKTLTAKFPFVSFNCEPKTPEPTDPSPETIKPESLNKD